MSNKDKRIVKHIFWTTDYASFIVHHNANRPIDIKKHGWLKEEMEKHGFNPNTPILVEKVEGAKNGEPDKCILEGQHRFIIARMLCIPVCYTYKEDDSDYDIAIMNNVVVRWREPDYLGRWEDERPAYKQLRQLMKGYKKLSIQRAVCAFTDVRDFKQVQQDFHNGSWEITSEEKGKNLLDTLYMIQTLTDVCNCNRAWLALQSCFNVPKFDPNRFIRQLKKVVKDDKIWHPCIYERDFLHMFNLVYNHGVRANQLMDLFMLATTYMKNGKSEKRRKKKIDDLNDLIDD